MAVILDDSYNRIFVYWVIVYVAPITSTEAILDRIHGEKHANLIWDSGKLAWFLIKKFSNAVLYELSEQEMDWRLVKHKYWGCSNTLCLKPLLAVFEHHTAVIISVIVG